MMTTYKTVRDAIQEIRDAYEREITKWYRIRRRAVERGLIDLALRIYEDIRRAQRDLSYYDFRDWEYYVFLFQMDNPNRTPKYHTFYREPDGE